MEQEEPYEVKRERAFRADAMNCVLRLFDKSALREMNAQPLKHRPGIPYAIEKGWVLKVADTDRHWLTREGALLGCELAGEREEWYLAMAGKLKSESEVPQAHLTSP